VHFLHSNLNSRRKASETLGWGKHELVSNLTSS